MTFKTMTNKDQLSEIEWGISVAYRYKKRILITVIFMLITDNPSVHTNMQLYCLLLYTDIREHLPLHFFPNRTTYCV